MDELSGQPSGAAWRRRQRRLRSWWRHEHQSVAAALATFSHRSAQRPKMAIDTNDAPEAGRPTPLAEVRPLCGVARHGGIGYELGAVGTRLMRAFRQAVAEMEEAARPRESSSKGNKIRRKKRRRKKKTPKTHSSSSFLRQSSPRGGVGIQGILHDAFEDAERTDVHPNIHTAHAEPLNSVHCKEVAGYLDEMNKLIEDKVIIGNTGEEIILKNGQPAFSLYSDRTHLYTCRWLDWLKNRHRYVWRLEGNGAPSDKTVKDLICLLLDLSSLRASTWASQRSSGTPSPNDVARPKHR